MKSKLKKFIDCIKNNKLICVILLISLVLHIATLCTLGYEYGLKSDDASYIASGIEFKNTGMLTMHGVRSGQIMPGMTWIIAFVSLIFGEGKLLMIVLKILWMIMGLLSVLGVYKITRLFANKFFSSMAALGLLVIDFIWMDNIILTETPFMLGFIYLIYASFKLERTKENKYFIQIIFFYMFSLMFKANIAVYPAFLIVYLLFKKYDFKVLLKQIGIALIVLLVFLIPWIIRNYIVFNKFIPLTYGTGNPLLMGTYQGYNYPEDNEEEYNKVIEENASEEMKSYINGTATDKLYKRGYYSLEKDGLIANYRMKKWWHDDKASMIKSYLVYKPYIIVYNSFLWEPVFGITKTDILPLRRVDIVLTAICGLIALIEKKYRKEVLFLGFNYVFQVLVYSYTFAFDRYGQTLIFLRFIVIGIGLQIIYDFIKNKFRKNKEALNEKN